MQFAILHRHVAALHEFYGDYMGVRIARKHVAWYLQANNVPALHKKRFNQLLVAAQQLHYIDSLDTPDSQKELAA